MKNAISWKQFAVYMLVQLRLGYSPFIITSLCKATKPNVTLYAIDSVVERKCSLAHGKCNAVKFDVWVTEESAAKLIWSSAILTPIYDWTRVLMPDFFSHFWWKLGMEQNLYLRPEQKYSAFLREVFPPFSIDIHISNALFLELCTLWLGENTTAQCNGDRFSETIFSRFPQLKKNAYSTCWNIE